MGNIAPRCMISIVEQPEEEPKLRKLFFDKLDTDESDGFDRDQSARINQDLYSSKSSNLRKETVAECCKATGSPDRTVTEDR